MPARLASVVMVMVIVVPAVLVSITIACFLPQCCKFTKD
jgi:hypothetical protein